MTLGWVITIGCAAVTSKLCAIGYLHNYMVRRQRLCSAVSLPCPTPSPSCSVWQLYLYLSLCLASSASLSILSPTWIFYRHHHHHHRRRHNHRESSFNSSSCPTVIYRCSILFLILFRWTPPWRDAWRPLCIISQEDESHEIRERPFRTF